MKLPVLNKTTEPVLISGMVSAVLGYVAQFAYLHGWVTSTQASQAVQELVPIVTAAAVMLVAFVIRSAVTPISKLENSKPVREIEKLVGDVTNVINPPPAPVAVAPVAPVVVPAPVVDPPAAVIGDGAIPDPTVPTPVA